MYLVNFTFNLVRPYPKEIKTPLIVDGIPSIAIVHQLKLTIEEITGVPVARLISINRVGMLLQDHHTVAHYIPAPSTDKTEAVRTSAWLQVAPEQPKVAVVVIPPIDSAACGPTVLRVRPDSSVRELKDKICRKMGFYDVDMASNGRNVDGGSNRSCISEFGIGEGSEIYVKQSLNVKPR